MLSSFEKVLEVCEINLILRLNSFGAIPWEAFLLNPRRLRGSDFLMRWSQGRWSEEMLITATRRTGKYVPVPYGPSSTAPQHNAREFEIYFERLDKANPEGHKRPDLLILHRDDFRRIARKLEQVGGAPPNYPQLPYVPENQLGFLLQRALLAVECENSLWVCQKMPHFGIKPRPMRRLGGKPGLPKAAIIPTIIVKDEDRDRLKAWQRSRRVPIHIWHVFYDLGYGASLDELERYIRGGRIQPRKQNFQGPGGQSQVKITYNLPYYLAYPLCKSVKPPNLKADSITDKNGHVLPFVRFLGGKFVLAPDAVQTLKTLASRKLKRR